MSIQFVHDNFASDLAGILPVTKSSFWDNWSLPGGFHPQSGENFGVSRDSCGEHFVKGCLNRDGHKGEYAGKAYFLIGVRSCQRSICPVCFERWASREGHRAVARFSCFSTKLKPVHVIVSPSVADIGLNYDDLKSKMYKLVKQVGIFGGMAIIHPFRSICKLCQHDKEHCNCGSAQSLEWYISPHFHLICYGWVRGDDVGSVYESSGWIIKNLGKRDTLAGTISYQLSHAGVHVPTGRCDTHDDDVDCAIFSHDCSKDRKHATITWFGALSYNKLHVPKDMVDVVQKCPLCEHELKELVFTLYDASDHFKDLPVGHEWFDDPGGWETLEYIRSEKAGKLHKPAEWEQFSHVDVI